MSTSAPTEGQESSLDPDEPHTPLWFTFLGLGLFLAGGIFLLATAGDEEPVVRAPESEAAAPAEEGEGAAPDAAQAAAEADPHAGHGHD